MTPRPRPRLAVWKFASCDGCQLTLLDCEDELLDVADAVEIRHFLEATSTVGDGPYDVSLVEGSISTAADVERIHHIRRESRTLVTIGACATAGGIQALRNFGDVQELLSIVYATPSFLSTLDTVTPISEHVTVDFELRGCPIDKGQLLELISATLAGRRPVVPTHPVCVECKQAGTPCLLVADGIPCLGPVTHAGCGALCPSYHRGCFGCYGPADTTNTDALVAVLGDLGVTSVDLDRLFHTFNAWAEPFRSVAVDPPTRRQATTGRGEP